METSSQRRLPAATAPRAVESVRSATGDDSTKIMFEIGWEITNFYVGDRFPVLPPSGHPARRLFIDSSSSLSATRFFGALMGGQQGNSPARYVHSLTLEIIIVKNINHVLGAPGLGGAETGCRSKFHIENNIFRKANKKMQLRLERGPSEQGTRSYRPFRRENSSSSINNSSNSNTYTATEGGGGGEIQRTELRMLQQVG